MISNPFNIHLLLPCRLLRANMLRSLANTRRVRMPRILLALLLGVFPHLFSIATAETVLLYDFEDSNGDFDLSAELIAEGINPGAWTVESSTIRDFGGNPGRAMASAGFNVRNAFVLPISIASGNVLQLDEVGFDQSASSSGPVDWEITILDVSLASGSTAGSFETSSAALMLEGLTGNFLIEISATGAASNRGTFRIDNFYLEGNIQPVPVPGAMMLLVSSCLGLLRLGRRGSSTASFG